MGTEPFCYNLCEYITIIVLEGQQEATLTLNKLRRHIINVSMLKINFVEVVLLIHLVKHISKSAVILSQH